MVRKKGVIRRQLFGTFMRQKPSEFWLYEDILSAHRDAIGWIVEIGTATGALSVYFDVWCRLWDKSFCTFDVKTPKQPSIGEMLKNDCVFNQIDIFCPQGRRLMAEACRPGPGFLLCDGPDKATEIIMFAPDLEPGSIVVGHDHGRQWRAKPDSSGGMLLYKIDPDSRRQNLLGGLPDLEFLQPWHDEARKKGARLGVFRKR